MTPPTSFTIDFLREPCRICGSSKPLVSDCPKCGAEYRTADPLVSRRQRIIDEARKTIAVPLCLGEPGSWVSLLDRLRPLPQTLLSALATAQLARTDSDATKAISEAFFDLSSFTADVVRTPHRRPLLSFWTEVEQLIDLLWQLYDVSLQAFDAPTPGRAQQLQLEGQAVLDEMVRHVERLDEWAGAVRALETETSGPSDIGLVAALRLAYRYLGQPDLLSFDSLGHGLLQTHLGLGDVPEGLGVTVATMALWAEHALNSDRMWECAREVKQLYMDRAPHATVLLNSSEWQGMFNGWSRELLEAGVQWEQVARAPFDSAEWFVRSLISFGSGLIEGAGIPMLRSLLAVHTRKPLSSFRRADIHSLLQQCRSLGLERLTDGISLSVRDAGAHHEYSVTEEGVMFTSSRRDVELVGQAELLDLTLALVESSLSLHLGTVAAVVLLADTPGDVLTKAVISGEAAIRSSLAMYGLKLVSYVSEGSLLAVRMTGEPPTEKLQVIVSMVGLLPVEAAGARFEFDMEERVSVLEGPLRPWREWSRAMDDEDKMAWFMTGVRTWREDGEPRFGGDQLRQWAATVLLDALDLPLPATARRTHLISMVATRVGDHELWKAATKLLSLRRVAVMQIEPSSEDQDVLATLRSWVKA